MAIQLFLPLILLALLCEYVDSTLGMGYGTTLTPLLLLMGYEPAQIVPSVLLSEFVTGILAGVFHHGIGNVNFKLGSHPSKVALALAVCSVFGTAAAVFIAISIPKWIIETYIGILVLAVGIGILLTVGKTFAFSWKKLIGLGLLATLNKGLSGGGYGPLVCGGQVLSGMGEREAVGITSLSEGLACLVGVAAYALTGSNAADWKLAPSFALGAVLSVPLAVLTVKKVPAGKMRWVIGSAVTVMGLFTLIKIF